MHRLLIVAAAAIVLAGCGSSRPNQAPKRSNPRVAQMKAVVRAWSRDLDEGDNAALARLFSLPATMIQDGFAFRLRTLAQVTAWNAALPCSGRIVSISVHGRFATAVFLLADRRTSKCDAPGTLAAARFTIVAGKITAWRQVPPPAQPPTA